MSDPPCCKSCVLPYCYLYTQVVVILLDAVILPVLVSNFNYPYELIVAVLLPVRIVVVPALGGLIVVAACPVVVGLNIFAQHSVSCLAQSQLTTLEIDSSSEMLRKKMRLQK